MPRPDYWRVYIVLIKPKGEKIFRELPLGEGTAVAYASRKQAQEVCNEQKKIYGARRAYVQMCGAIS